MTCNSEHNFRAQKSSAATATKAKKAASGSTAKTPRKTSATAAREEFEQRIHSGDSFKAYSIHQVFQADDLISHKKFGDGYVMSANEGGKVTVAFVDGEKTLVHGVPE